MPDYEKLKEQLPTYKASHGHEFLVFIAPSNMSKWEAHVHGSIQHGQEPMFVPRGDLDIFFVPWRQAKRDATLITPKRLSLGAPDL